jgi:hypothetical protein
MAVPVVDAPYPDGDKAMKIQWFAVFFLEDIIKDNGTVSIKGRFIRCIVEADVSDSVEDYGLLGIKLTH